MTYTHGLLSVIMPLYNTGEPFIACMDSLIAQTWKNLEIIIVNDGSTDNSAQLAQAYVDRYPHVHLLHQRNGESQRRVIPGWKSPWASTSRTLTVMILLIRKCMKR